MTILLTGGTGLTSSRLAALLKQQGTPAIIASRSGASVHDFPGVKFDWTDEATYDNPFVQASDITAIYIVVPALGLFKSMEAFLDYSIEKGVKRFILLSFSATVAAQYDHGAIHRYLIDKKVEYGVLCPTWFMGQSDLTRTLQAQANQLPSMQKTSPSRSTVTPSAARANSTPHPATARSQ